MAVERRRSVEPGLRGSFPPTRAEVKGVARVKRVERRLEELERARFRLALRGLDS